MEHIENLQKIYDILKEYGCERTYSFHPKLQNRFEIAPYFYQTFEEEKPEFDSFNKPEWREEIVATLDVCVSTKMPKAEKKKMRFDIDWSEKAKLFSMYISLPTSSRSIPLSKSTYKSYDAVVAEVIKWLQKASCKKVINKAVAKKIESKFEQLSLFSLERS